MRRPGQAGSVLSSLAVILAVMLLFRVNFTLIVKREDVS